MNKAALRFTALAGALALIVTIPAGAATKKTTKKTTKKPVATAAPTTAAPASTAAPATTAKPATAGKPTGAAVKVGLIFAESGRAASAYNKSGSVADAWTKWVNETQGGVGGRPVEVIAVDDKSDAATAQGAAKDLVESKGVVGIVLQDSTAEAAVENYINDKQFPIIGGSANNASAGIGNGRSPYYFMMASGGAGVSTIPVVVAQKLNQRPFIAAACAEVAACETGARLYEGKAKEIGLDYSGVLKITAASPNFTAECLDIAGRIAAYSVTGGFVLLGVDPVTGGRIVKDCARQSYRGYFGASANTVTGALVDKIDANLGGFINGFPWFADAPPVQAFRDAMAKYSPKTDYRDPASTTTWAALELFRKTMNAAGAPNSKDDVLKAYWGIKGETLDGLLPGPVTFTQGKPSTLLQCVWPVVYTSKAGKFAALNLDDNSGNGAKGDLKSYCV